MGHANRSGQHHVIRLDAQPRRICLPAGWSCHANANTHGVADSDTNRNRDGNSHCNGDPYSNSELDPKANAHTQIRTDA
jgi:hypothetical protein